LEIHNRRYWDTLSTLLLSSILFDIANLNKFVEESTNALQHQSSSAKQINRNHKNIIDASIEVNKYLIIYFN
jgi:methyl-accepting chemotaxis protein